MKIGVLKCREEPLVPITPSLAKKLQRDGFEIQIESGAGEQSYYPDNQFADVGAHILDRKETVSGSDVLLTVSSVQSNDLDIAREDTVLIGKFNPRINSNELRKLKESHLKVFSLDLLPRSTLAQSMDVLSSMASLSGYKAVVKAAERFPGYFPMLTTSAGTVPPARVLVLGAGVAGLQAIATAKRLGAVVEAFDVRSAAKEEVESLGARFVEVEGSTERSDAGGYAVSQTEEYIRRQKEIINERAIKSDIIISTANIPGRKAPLLVEEKTVRNMQAGSVIVDLAAESGGNCEVTKNGKEIQYNGITIIGDSKLHITMPKRASGLYANNLYNFLKFLFKDKDKPISFEHEIVRNTYLGNLSTN